MNEMGVSERSDNSPSPEERGWGEGNVYRWDLSLTLREKRLR